MSRKYPIPEKECSTCHEFKSLSEFPSDHAKCGVLKPARCLKCMIKVKRVKPKKVDVDYHKYIIEKLVAKPLPPSNDDPFFETDISKLMFAPIEPEVRCEHKVPVHFCTICRTKPEASMLHVDHEAQCRVLCQHRILRVHCVLCKQIQVGHSNHETRL